MSDYLTPLPVESLRAAGIPAPWVFGRRDKVRFYELDALNHVNNTAYLRWFETLRVAWLSAYGLSDYGPNDPTIVVRALSCDYHAPMFLNEDYIATARCVSVRTTSFVKEYGIWSGGQLKAAGQAVIVVTDDSGTTKMPLPDDARARFIDIDGARDDG